ACSARLYNIYFAKFAKVIHFKDIISGEECAVRDLPAEVSEDIRREVCKSLKKAVPPKRNLSVSEHQALKAQRKSTNVVVLLADNGNTAVVMSSANYHEKITALLEDEAYRPLSKDLTEKVARLTSILLVKSSLPNEVIKQLRHNSSIPPRIYGLPKIHKESVHLRRIVNSIGSPTYSLAKYLTGLLQLLVGACIHHVRNSMDFIETLKGITISPSDVFTITFRR
ncbi:hypothetical protein C0J52_22747, partial [Blattella germanica]